MLELGLVCRSVAQLVEFWSPKPAVGGSSPSSPARCWVLGIGMKTDSRVRKFFSFIREVRQEVDRVTWPSKNEVIITTVVVFVLAILGSLFFTVVDTTVYRLIHAIIGR